MKPNDMLKYIVEEMHSVVFATTDNQGRPVTCAIDLMDYDENSLYFLTARGKRFYERLKANDNIAFTAMKGEDTLSCVSISVRTSCQICSPKILIWPKFILMHARAVLLPSFRSSREPVNNLIFPNSR